MSYIQKPGGASRKRVTMIPGKFIGPETTRAVREIFEAAKCPIDWDFIEKFDFSS